MAFNNSKLMGKIIEVCGTQTKFAREMSWSERTASLKMNGKVDWKQKEIIKACKILGIEYKEITTYFFA